MPKRRIRRTESLRRRRLCRRISKMESGDSAPGLPEEESHYRAFFDNAAVGMVELDMEGRFVRANETFCRITGYSRKELLGGMTMADITHPEDRKRDLEIFRLFREGARSSYEIEKRYIRKDRGIAWIQVWAGMIRSPEGVPQRMAAVVRNITREKTAEAERLEAERILEEAQRRLKLALEASQIGSWELDLRTRKAWRTERHDQIFGYASLQPEWNYETFLRHVVEEDRAKVDRAFREAFAGKPTWSFECRIRRADGAERWIWGQGRFHYDEDGKPVRVYGLVADVTERKLLEENLQTARRQAEEASRAKSEFVANMSHEIRTPMTVFMSALEHLLQIDRSPERRPLLEMAEQSGQRLRTLIDDILDFSRIEARRVEIDERPFDLRSCVEETVALMSLPAQKKGLSLQTDISPALPPVVHGDSDRLGQILINLVSNAVKFTDQGEVKVSAHPRAGSEVEFMVSDTGIGIPSHKHDLLFRSFSQMDSSFTRKYGGTGLGLSISRGLVELMGGTIRVESREGEGSAFCFVLPLRAAGASGAAKQEDKAEEPDRIPPQTRILIVEDEPMIRELLLLTLSRRGWRADTAENGRQALDRWRRGGYDLVLMDLQMPQMDGMEATRRIRQAERDSGRALTWIVGFTAHVRQEVKEACLEIGMDRVLTKPVDTQELFEVLEECLAAETI